MSVYNIISVDNCANKIQYLTPLLLRKARLDVGVTTGDVTKNLILTGSHANDVTIIVQASRQSEAKKKNMCFRFHDLP